MNASELKIRLIVYLAVVCFLCSVGGSVALANGTPTSGALLTINGNAGGAVNIAIYDSQIHSALVQAVPEGASCTGPDTRFPTDAYVLQGGSWTGCDPGDAFEVTDDNPNAPHQAPGLLADFFGFKIETHYRGSILKILAATRNEGNTTTYMYSVALGPDLQVGQSIIITGMSNNGDNGTFTITAVVSGTFTVVNANGVTASEQSGQGTVPICNTSKTICTDSAGPDSGFLTVTNSTGNDFTGTITLQGNSPIAGGFFCPASKVEGGPGVALDSWTTGLSAGKSVTLALSTDSSNCGGFDAAQRQTLTAGSPSIFNIGNDAYTMIPFNSAHNDQITLLPVPVPAGPLSNDGTTFGSETLAVTPTSPFSATNFPSQASIPYADFSASGNPVGLELQLICTPGNPDNSDCGTFLNTSQVDFTVDKNSFPDGIGGAQFLGQHDEQCPTSDFNVDIFFSYTATAPDPIKGKTLGNSCFVTTFDPTADAVGVGATVNQKVFVGFQSPVVNDPPNAAKVNKLNAGQSVPLIWQTFDPISGKPVINLTLCTDITLATCPTTNPWVFVGTIGVSCSADVPLSQVTPAGNSGLQNFLNGTYEVVLKTSKTAKVGTCFTPVLEFSFGSVSFNVAIFEFVK